MGWEYFAIAIVLMVASYLITSMSMPKAQSSKPETMEAFDFPQANEGTPQAVVFGDTWSGDWMVLWYGNYRVGPIRGEGGKK